MLLGLAAGCTSPPAFRGQDHDAILPLVRARFALREEPPPATDDRFRFLPAIEAEVSYVAGDFPQQATRPEYHARVVHVAYAPELAWRALRIGPMIGLSHGDIAVESGSTRIDARGLGILYGGQASWALLPWLSPYGRLVVAEGIDWAAPRWEIGLELRATPLLGFQVAYGHQTNILDEDLFAVGTGNAHIETDGVSLGLSLHF